MNERWIEKILTMNILPTFQSSSSHDDRFPSDQQTKKHFLILKLDLIHQTILIVYREYHNVYHFIFYSKTSDDNSKLTSNLKIF